MLFILGRSLYRFQPVTGSPLGRFFRVTITAIRNRKQQRTRTAANHPDAVEAPLIENSAGRKEHWLDWAVGPGLLTKSFHEITAVISFPEDFTEEQVYEVKLVYGVFQVFYTSVFFWYAPENNRILSDDDVTG